MKKLTALIEKEVSQYRERIRQTARAAVARRLRRIVKTHEEKHGPTLPTTDAPGWVAARDILADLAALVEELR